MQDNEKHNAIHVKFIMQPEMLKQQGNGVRMQRHVNECSDILFSQKVQHCYGVWPARLNQFSDVRKTRHGENWREEKVKA